MAKNPNGTTVTFDSGFLAEITALVMPDQTREAFDSSHMGTLTWRTKLLGKLVDQGELTVDIFFEPETAPPIDSDAETLVINFPDGSSWSFSGGMTATGGAAVPLDGLMTQTVTITVSGLITISGDSSSG